MSDDAAADDAADELLAAAYALDGPEASRALYARWADTYESGFIADSRYVYHEHVARLFVEHASDHIGADAAIVDVGCGTGLAGAALRHHITADIDGIDISPEMLRQAAAKQHAGVPVYRSLIEVDLTKSVPIASDSYAGAVSVGTFTHGHVGPGSLVEVIRIVRPGGIVAIGINAAHFASAGFGAAFGELVDAGTIADLRLVDVPIYAAPDGSDDDSRDPDRTGRVAVFEAT